MHSPLLHIGFSAGHSHLATHCSVQMGFGTSHVFVHELPQPFQTFPPWQSIVVVVVAVSIVVVVVVVVSVLGHDPSGMHSPLLHIGFSAGHSHLATHCSVQMGFGTSHVFVHELPQSFQTFPPWQSIVVVVVAVSIVVVVVVVVSVLGHDPSGMHSPLLHIGFSAGH